MVRPTARKTRRRPRGFAPPCPAEDAARRNWAGVARRENGIDGTLTPDRRTTRTSRRGPSWTRTAAALPRRPRASNRQPWTGAAMPTAESARVHPTALVAPEADLGDDVVVGPHVVI